MNRKQNENVKLRIYTLQISCIECISVVIKRMKIINKLIIKKSQIEIFVALDRQNCIGRGHITANKK